MHAAFAAALAIASAGACASERRAPPPAPTYRDGVGELLHARCTACHSGAAPAGGWSADTYVDAIGCTSDGAVATARRPDGSDAPLLAALARPDHASVVTGDELARLRAWVSAGAPALGGGVHPPSFLDPRADDSHGRMLRAKSYRPMLEPDDADACGRCHEGAVVRPPTAGLPAPGATPCTTCHAEPGGPLACTTCHGVPASRGKPGHAYPPRDPCFHPEERDDRAHAAHAGPSASRAEGLACSACHPTPALGQLAPPHADGYREVWFDPAVAGRSAAWEPTSRRCTGTCHARGGARPELAWTDAPTGATCDDCHRTPPPAHYAGPCTSCHREANAAGTALASPVLHVNGRADLGDGSGRCGACHGRGDDPWPTTGAHAAHAQPKGAKAVACETCHELPQPGARHPTGRGAAAVRFAGLAVAGARRPSYDAATRTCANTYCHEYVGGALQQPTWTAGASQATCGTCHAVPPPLPHVQDRNCAAAGCHEGLTATTGDAMTPVGTTVHVDGVVDRRAP